MSRELRRNFPPERDRYTARLAHEQALYKRTRRGREQRLKNDLIRTFVTAQLKRRRSPEQIAGIIKQELGEAISHEAIYQFIYAQISYNKPRRGCEDLRPCLRRRRKRRIPHGARRCQRVLKPQGPSIDERPAVVNRRGRVGDWESDTVESTDHAPGINTLVEGLMEKCDAVLARPWRTHKGNDTINPMTTKKVSNVRFYPHQEERQLSRNAALQVPRLRRAIRS